MLDQQLTPERILEVSEEVLRRFGPQKASVMDIAKALGVSHGSVYRYFPAKAALLEAVVGRWLGRIGAPLAMIAAEEGPAVERLQRWFDVLTTLKRRKADDDPELFATYLMQASEPHGPAATENERLKTHIAKMIDDGIRQAAFGPMDSIRVAASIFDATLKFHHPNHAVLWKNPGIDAEFDGVWRLILRGLGVRLITL